MRSKDKHLLAYRENFAAMREARFRKGQINTMKFLSAATILAAVWTSTAHADVVLRYNRWLPAAHHLEKNVLGPWMKRVKEVTEGRVVIQPTTSSLGPAPKQHELVVSGIADVVLTTDSYTPGLFPLSEIMELPFIGDNAETLSSTYWRVYETYFAEKNPYRRTKLITASATASYHLFNSARPIKNVEDVAGLKIQVSGTASTELLGMLGFTTVSGTVAQMVENLSAGTVDGVFLSDDAVRSFGLIRYLKHRTYFPRGLGSISLIILLNEKKWQAISPKDQAAIESISGAVLAREIGISFDRANLEAFGDVQRAGIKLSDPSLALMDRVQAIARTLDEKWIKVAGEKGVDGVAAVKMLRDSTR